MVVERDGRRMTYRPNCTFRRHGRLVAQIHDHPAAQIERSNGSSIRSSELSKYLCRYLQRAAEHARFRDKCARRELALRERNPVLVGRPDRNLGRPRGELRRLEHECQDVSRLLPRQSVRAEHRHEELRVVEQLPE